MTGRIIAGIGLRPGTEAADILSCLDEALAQAGCGGQAGLRLATLASRVAEPAWSPPRRPARPNWLGFPTRR